MNVVIIVKNCKTEVIVDNEAKEIMEYRYYRELYNKEEIESCCINDDYAEINRDGELIQFYVTEIDN